LHDQGAIAVRFFGQRVELGNRVVESLFGKMAGTVRRVEDLVVEDGEVEGKTKADGVGRGELSLGNIGSVLKRVVSTSIEEICRACESTLYASCAAVAATLRFSPDANSAR
jgi:hypothetical protein